MLYALPISLILVLNLGFFLPTDAENCSIGSAGKASSDAGRDVWCRVVATTQNHVVWWLKEAFL